MSFLSVRDNDSLNVNPPMGDQYLSNNGSNWLWAVTAVFVVSFLAMFAMSFRARAGEKIFHYLFIIALLVGSITYFSQASDLAWRVVSQANNVGNGTRQIFWAKYIHWVVSFPVVITALGLLSGISWATILYQIFLSWIWVISYLVGAFTSTKYKWGFFAFGTFAWLLLAVSTMRDNSSSAKRVNVGRDHSMLGGWANFLWLMYPIAWGLSDGGNRIGVTGSFIFFGILDILLVVGLAFAFLTLSRKWDYGHLNLAFTQYGRVHTHGGTFPEKSTGHTGVVHNTGGVVHNTNNGTGYVAGGAPGHNV